MEAEPGELNHGQHNARDENETTHGDSWMIPIQQNHVRNVLLRINGIIDQGENNIHDSE